MANAFSKQETAMFDDVLSGFSDAMVMSKNVTVNSSGADPQTIERSQGGAFWRPMPYIATVYNGIDQTANFKDYTQLMVPATIGFQKSVPIAMSATDAGDRDYQMKAISKSAVQGLGSAVNQAALNVVATEGSVFVKRSGVATGYDDLAIVDPVLSETGVPIDDRVMALNTRDYNAMAGNLASRQTFSGEVSKAYHDAFIGSGIAGFDLFKMDTGYRLAAAVPGAGVTVNGANQRYVPKATSTASSGEIALVDNRVQTLAVTVGAAGAIKAGDKFTVGINSVHPITKIDTGQLKTFTIKAILTGGGTAGANTIQISPPIIAADSAPTAAESQYKNVVATPASGTTLTFLNTVSAGVNPFWRRDSIELLPSTPGQNPGGIDFLRASTDQGLTIQMTRQAAINDLSGKYRWDCWFGVVNLNPEMNGIEMFSQT